MEWELCLDQNLVRGWVAERLPSPQNRNITPNDLLRMSAVGYMVAGEMVAGFLFSNHVEVYRCVDVHIALQRPAGSNGALFRSILANVAVYPFEVLKCRRISAYVPKKQRKIRRVLKLCGFREEGVMRLGFNTDSCVVYGLLRHQAPRWLFS